MLENLAIENFRGFRRLTIDRLGRVNLIVGKNSIGKTTLLEAVWLYAARMRPEAIQQLLLEREEFLSEQDPEAREVEVDVRALFHGRAARQGREGVIVVGPVSDENEQVTLSLPQAEHGGISEPGAPSCREAGEGAEAAGSPDFASFIVTHHGERQYYPARLGPWSRSSTSSRSRMAGALPPLLRAGGVDDEVVGRWWDAVALTESEEKVMSFLRLLVPIARVTLVESPKRLSKRVFVVRLKEEKSPQPLKSLGDGVERMFRTVLALEYARRSLGEPQVETLQQKQWTPRNLLLIDEVESGIHYAALRDYWKMIFALSRELDVQIFATTHSWDCVQGFQEAAVDNQKCEGVLVGLESAGGKHRAVTFTEEELSIVTRENIEVR